MKPILLLASFFLLAVPLTPVHAGQAPFPLAGLKESKVTLTGRYGDERTTAVYTVKSAERDGKACWHILWDTNIKRIESWIGKDGWPIRTVYEKFKSKERVEIDYNSQGASYRYNKDGAVETSRVEEPGLIESLLVDILLLSYPFERPREITAPIIDADSDDGDTYSMFAELNGQEELTVAGQKVKAYKIKMGIKGVSGWFAPTFYFWYSVEQPHRYLRYQGPEEEFVLKDGELSL